MMRVSLKLSLLLAPVLLAGCATQNVPVKPVAHIESSVEELINRSEVVAIVSSVDVATDLEQKAAHWGYDLKRKEVLPGLGMYLLTFDCPPGIDPHVAGVELERLQPQSTVEANHKYTLQTALSSHVPLSQPPLRYADALIEWPEGGCEALTMIGVIDGLVDPKAIMTGPSFKIHRKNFLNEGAAENASLHGTAIADILVGSGRLKDATIYNASVVSIDDNGVQYSGVEPMLKALDWMVSQDVRVVNISLAGPYNRTLHRGIKRAADKGLIIVAAVGNDGANSAPRYPAAFPDVIAATAIDNNMNIYERAVRGKHVDVSAPGVEIFIGHDETGRYVSGTSIAAPFVSAKIASDIKYKHAESLKEIRTLLKEESLDLGPEGQDATYGAGLIKANNCAY